MKDWQHGFELDLLRGFAKLFQECHKPYVFGAFGLQKERDIATALHEGKLIYDKGTPPRAAAVFNLLKSGSSHQDFAQRQVPIAAGSLMIRSLAVADPEAGLRVLGALLQRARDAASVTVAWCEIFEEDQKSKDLLSDFGFAYVTTKIAASSDLKGLYVLGAKAELEKLDPLEFPSVIGTPKLELSEKEISTIQGELDFYMADADRWAQHYSSYNKRGSWTAFSLRGFVPADPSFIIKPAEMSKQWKEENKALLEAGCSETIAAEFFPKTLEIVNKHLPQKKERVRFMRLAPGGELTRHADITDRNAGLKNGMVMRMHFPIATNEGCLFSTVGPRGEAKATHFRRRGLYYLDTRKPHAVKNAGDTERIHLVVDTFADEALRRKLEKIA